MPRRVLPVIALLSALSLSCQRADLVIPSQIPASSDRCAYEDGFDAAGLEEPEFSPEEIEELMAQSSAPLAPAVIDVLVAYTPEARMEQGGRSGIEKLIRQGIADANAAFAESGVQATLRLVGTMELERNDSRDFYLDLRALRDKRDGFWDEVHAERDRLGADQVTVVGVYEGSDVNGLAPTVQKEDYAFSVIKTGSFWRYTMAHEIGHNLGLEHKNGYVSTKGNFRTMMSKADPPRIRRFSNPKRKYQGFATGDTDHDSVSIANRNVTRVSRYRPAR